MSPEEYIRKETPEVWRGFISMQKTMNEKAAALAKAEQTIRNLERIIHDLRVELAEARSR